jgi:hypothetical protein
MREESKNKDNDFWLPLEKFVELGRHNNILLWQLFNFEIFNVQGY